MSQQLYIHKYTLQSKDFLNAKTRQTEHHGVLIRDEKGFGNIHPWLSLGDPTLEELIDDLRGSRLHALTHQALTCLRIDGEARSQGRNLFDSLSIPHSHATLPQLSTPVAQEAVQAGFITLKVKVGRDLPAAISLLNSISQKHPRIQWRLDFNETLQTPEAGKAFLDKLLPETLQKIEFLEDPFPYSTKDWAQFHAQTKLPLALDRALKFAKSGFTHAVIKPALHDPFEIIKSLPPTIKVLITSYMDHPLGQTFAAYQAARIAKNRPLVSCGLITHSLFCENVFSKQLSSPTPRFKPPPGTGLGFDSLLYKLPWKKL